jgi:uncharacterized protein with PIN domain
MEPTRFVTDTSLAGFGRWLRFLGYDVEILKGALLDEVFAAARRSGRVALTLSPRRPRRPGVRVAAVERGREEESLRLLVARHAPQGPPFSRCVECNTALQRRSALEAAGEVPGGVLRTARELRFCPTCGKWYWEGSHVTRMRAALAARLGRPLEEEAPGAGAAGGA